MRIFKRNLVRWASAVSLAQFCVGNAFAQAISRTGGVIDDDGYPMGELTIAGIIAMLLILHFFGEGALLKFFGAIFVIALVIGLFR